MLSFIIADTMELPSVFSVMAMAISTRTNNIVPYYFFTS